MEIYKTLSVFRTEMECPQCKRGRMQFTGIVIQGEAPMLLHICGSCGFQQQYEKAYPSHVVLKEHDCLREDAQ